MLKVFTLISGLMLNVYIAQANEATSFRQIITENDKTEILKLIDHACADSWCSGDYDYKFSSFSCNDTNAICILGFKIIDRDAKPGEVKAVNRRCIFKNISSINDVVENHALTEVFYDQLNYCVSNRESGKREIK